MEHILEWINSDVKYIFKSSQGPASNGSVLSYLSVYIYIYFLFPPSSVCVSVHLYTIRTRSIPSLIYKWLQYQFILSFSQIYIYILNLQNAEHSFLFVFIPVFRSILCFQVQYFQRVLEKSSTNPTHKGEIKWFRKLQV